MNHVSRGDDAASLSVFLSSILKPRYRNLCSAELYEHAVRRGEGQVASSGAFVAHTGVHTGRSAADKFVVRDSETESAVWWGQNKAMSRDDFEVLFRDFLAHTEGLDLYMHDLHAGADPHYQLQTRVYTELAWHGVFIRHLLIDPEAS